jgi:hypothetical protein
MFAPPLKPLWTFDEVVDALGGHQGVGVLTRQLPHAVKTWQKQRGRFPTKYYFTMKWALADAGYRAPLELWGFHSEYEIFRGPKAAA